MNPDTAALMAIAEALKNTDDLYSMRRPRGPHYTPAQRRAHDELRKERKKERQRKRDQRRKNR